MLALLVGEGVFVLDDKMFDDPAFLPVEYVPGEPLGAGVFTGFGVFHQLRRPRDIAGKSVLL